MRCDAAPGVTAVIFCCFSDDSARLHEAALAAFGSPCADWTPPLHSRRMSGEGTDEFTSICWRALALRRADAGDRRPRPAREGTFDIPAGAHFNQDKAREGRRVLQERGRRPARSPARNVLIQQRGKPVYHETFGVQDVVSKAPITDKTIFRLSSLTKAITSVVARCS